jgi:hypothetical protein
MFSPQSMAAPRPTQPKIGDAAVTFVVVGKVGGHKDLPALIKPMLDGGHVN